MDKESLVRNIAARHGYSFNLQKLLRDLTKSELKTLQNNPDLVDKVVDISKREENALIEILEEEFDLDIEDCATTGKWIGIDQIEKSKPNWGPDHHIGWAAGGHEEFLEFARNFMLQEVRINLCVRYITEVKESAKKKDQELATKRANLGPGYGLYL